MDKITTKDKLYIYHDYEGYERVGNAEDIHEHIEWIEKRFGESVDNIDVFEAIPNDNCELRNCNKYNKHIEDCNCRNCECETKNCKHNISRRYICGKPLLIVNHWKHIR